MTAEPEPEPEQESCGPGRHFAIMVWDTELEMLSIVCVACAHAIISAHESQGSWMWDLMREINGGTGV